MTKVFEKYEVVVIGGGLAGLCAAVASARQGAKTCLIHNRPVLGGNSSSEIRVTPHGAAAFHAYARETGIISELLIQERAQNHEEIFENGWTNSIWDLTLYDLVQSTANLTLFLNTEFKGVEMDQERTIRSVITYTMNAEVERVIEGSVFIDCTGDGLVAEKAGCEWRMGSESRDEFDEPHAPQRASDDVMGSSIHFKTRRLEYPVPFKAPEWAIKYEDASFFYENGRAPKDERGGFWWLEIGVPYHTIHQNEDIRHELTRHALGVWDWMKNKDPKMREVTRNYALEWMGQVPGKRESRRIMGLYLMTEHDPQSRTVFYDEIAYGGWFIDIHTPGGLLAKNSEPASKEDYNSFSEYGVKSYAGPYGIPLRCLIAKDVDNLMMAGRNVSVTHAALGTVRVMSTTALMGQAAGTTAAVSVKKNLPLYSMPEKAITEIQQVLLREGCFLPNFRNKDSNDLARKASVSASTEALEYGAGPETPCFHEGLAIWKDQPQYLDAELKCRKGLFIAVATKHVKSISIFINNKNQEASALSASLLEVENIWDYRIDDLPIIGKKTVSVAPGNKQWVTFDFDIQDLTERRFYRLDVLPQSGIEWLLTPKIVTGHMAVYQIGNNKMRRFGNGHTFSFQVDPPQPCYSAANILTGITRPYQFTNLWKSDPSFPLPQWVDLNWEEEQLIKQVELTFPGHLIREYHAYRPFYRDPQCPRDYSVLVDINGQWIQVADVRENYQRRRVHTLLGPVITRRLRLSISATNSDPSAQVYEIRCY